MPSRLKILTALFFLVFISLIARLFFWQIIKGKTLASQARLQYQKSEKIIAPRGNILANDKSALAARTEAYLVFAYLPEMIDTPSKVADLLAPLFLEEVEIEGKYEDSILHEAGRIKSQLTNEESVWIPLKHKVGPDIKEKIEDLKIEGIGFEIEEKRVYPEASSAAHLLGFVGKDSDGIDTGYFGIEGYYDLILSGKHGYLSRESDASGIPILLGSQQEVSAIEGVDLITYIDKTIQHVIDDTLKKGLEKYGAIAGSIIVMDPKTGGILAQASYPSYDPINYQDFSDELFANPIVSNSFEPGSVFKILVMAAALDEGVVEPDTLCEVCAGPLPVDKYLIETWNKVYRPDSDMVDVIVNSDNVGMAWVAQKLGADKLYEHLAKFGIGQLSEVDLQGEWAPTLRKKDSWNIVDVSTAGFGQGVAVTPIQLIRAASAIANEGVILTPKVVKKLEGAGWEDEVASAKAERVISKDTANMITAMMVEAAKNGEAKWTNIRGFKVAGKTGTAQIPIAGHYDEEKTIASFVGFAPADDPKFIMLVTLREPTSSPWASETAAPLWYSIAKDLFLYFGIQPEN